MIDLPELTPSIFTNVMEFAYSGLRSLLLRLVFIVRKSGKVNVTGSLLIPLMAAASSLGLSGIASQAIAYVRTNLTLRNIAWVYARSPLALSVEPILLDMIGANFSDGRHAAARGSTVALSVIALCNAVASTVGFLEIGEDRLITLLKWKHMRTDEVQ